MDLLENIKIQPVNILPADGTVIYYGTCISSDDANAYFNSLLEEIEWRHDQVNLFGKIISTKRKVAWYGDKPFKYYYSGTTKTAVPWNDTLASIKEIVEEKTGETFNSCLLNLYHDGKEGMSWHSDNEKELKKKGAIASLSLGATRKFSFKHKRSKEKISIPLGQGSLLIMTGDTQTHWLHQLPLEKKVTRPRINLTFRTIV